MEFDWDAVKEALNRRKHGVSFAEAQTVFSDPNALEWFDEEHSRGEERYVTVGLSMRLRVLFVVHTQRHGDQLRIISARKATKMEAEYYAKT